LNTTVLERLIMQLTAMLKVTVATSSYTLRATTDWKFRYVNQNKIYWIQTVTVKI